MDRGRSGAGRDRLPVLARRAGRRAVARRSASPGRSIALGHTVSRPRARRRRARRRDRRCRRSSPPPGARWACRTTGRWRGSRSGRWPTPGCGAGSPSTPSTCCTCTSPRTFSLSSLALFVAEGPIVATFHTSTERSRATRAFGGRSSPLMEKVTARIAVSPMARRVQVEHLGGDAVEIPNGVDVRRSRRARCCPATRATGDTVGFLGPLRRAAQGHGGAARRAGAAGAGRPGPAAARRRPRRPGRAAPRRRPGARRPARRPRRGRRRDEGGGAALDGRLCAPNTGGESFGMVLTEAMAAGAPVLASDLDAFRAVLSAEAAAGSRACCSRPATPARSPPRSPRCSTTRRAGPPSVRAAARGRPSSTGRSSRRDVRAGLPRRGRGRPPPRARPDRGGHPVTAPTLGVAGARASPTAWAVVVVVLLPGRGRHRGSCVVPGRGGWTACTGGRTPPARASPTRWTGGRAAALRVADAPGRVRGGAPTLPALRGRRVRGPRRVPDGAAPGRRRPRRAARRRRTRSPAGSPARPRRAARRRSRAELADAEQLRPVARRVHNDAVRDTLDLRSRRLVRWLRLAGTAPVPAYFEIADPQPWQPPSPRTEGRPPAAAPVGTVPDASRLTYDRRVRLMTVRHGSASRR